MTTARASGRAAARQSDVTIEVVTASRSAVPAEPHSATDTATPAARSTQPRLLIVDDEASLRQFLAMLFAADGYQVETAEGVASAQERLTSASFDVVLTDLMMPDGSGLDLLREIKNSEARTAVVLMTAYTTTRSAIEAMRTGAFDYVPKPFDVEELKIVVRKACETTRLVAENSYLRQELAQRYGFDNIVGHSARMRAVFDLVDRVARTQTTVLITGESGTGKELVARAIHFAGPRRDRRFQSINCGAFPESLLESELFGHERGAFTGAVREKRGLFQEADGGTLFLDEVGETTPAMQVKLLRALQERLVRRVGANTEEHIDVRIIAATNQNLEEKVRQGAFREDLYYRIAVIPIELPPLRHRREDIPPLVQYFLDKYTRESGAPPRRISLEALRALESHDWPGNVRELENIIQRALALTSGDVIEASDLPAAVRGRGRTPAFGTELPKEGLDLEGFLDGQRAALLREALDRCGGNQTAAAEMLRISFRSFRYYARKLGVSGSD